MKYMAHFIFRHYEFCKVFTPCSRVKIESYFFRLKYLVLYMSSVFSGSSVLTTKLTFEADLPADMLLEIAYWCDYPELYNLIIALNDDRWMENNELFWSKYFQKIITKDTNLNDFRIYLNKSWHNFSNLEKIKYIYLFDFVANCDKEETFEDTLFYEKNLSSGSRLFKNDKIKLFLINNKSVQISFLNTSNIFNFIVFSDIFDVGVSNFDDINSLPITYYHKLGIFSITFTIKENPYNQRCIKIFVDYLNKTKLLHIVYQKYGDDNVVPFHLLKISQPASIFPDYNEHVHPNLQKLQTDKIIDHENLMKHDQYENYIIYLCFHANNSYFKYHYKSNCCLRID